MLLKNLRKIKIDNKFKNDGKTIMEFVETEINKMQKNNRWYFTINLLVNIIVSLLTLCSIAIATYIIWYMNNRVAKPSVQSMPYIIAISTVLLFILSITIIIYQNKMKAKEFRLAADKIQYLVMEYYFDKEQFNTQEKHKIFRKEIIKIYKKALLEKKQANFKNSILKALIGDHD